MTCKLQLFTFLLKISISLQNRERWSCNHDSPSSSVASSSKRSSNCRSNATPALKQGHHDVRLGYDSNISSIWYYFIIMLRVGSSIQWNILLLLMAEIRRSPVEVGSLSHCLQGLIHATSGCLGFLKHQQYFFWSNLTHDSKEKNHVFSCKGSDLWASWLSELACLMEPPSSTVSCSEKARGIPPSHMEISSWARKLKQPTNTKCSNCRTRAICWTVTLSLFMTILLGMFCFPQASLLLKGCPALPAQCWKL